MKKMVFICIATFFLISIFSCSIINELKNNTKSQSISNFGESDFYFARHNKIYRLNKEKDIIEYVTDCNFNDEFANITVMDGYIYYRKVVSGDYFNNYDNLKCEIRRMKINGKNDEKITDGYGGYFFVSKNILYYYNFEGGNIQSVNLITKVKTDYESTKYDDLGGNTNILVYKDRIFLPTIKLYELLEKENKIKTLNEEMRFLNALIYKDKVFNIGNLNNKDSLCYYDLKTERISILDSADTVKYEEPPELTKTNNFLIYNEKVYYTLGNATYSVNIDGSKEEKLFDESYPYMRFIFNDKIYSYIPTESDFERIENYKYKLLSVDLETGEKKDYQFPGE